MVVRTFGPRVSAKLALFKVARTLEKGKSEIREKGGSSLIEYKE